MVWVSKRLLIALFALLLGVGMLIMFRLSFGYANFVADAVSRPAAKLLSNLTTRVSFPLAEALALLFALWAAFGLIKSAAQSLTQKSVKPVSGFAQSLALTVSLVMLSYALLWSPIYHLEPLAEQLHYESDAQYTLSELVGLCRDLSAQANQLRERAAAAMPPYGEPELIERAQLALSQVEALSLSPKPVKLARYPEFFKRLGMAGVYAPWTGEAIISGSEPALSLPFLVAHESSHQLGFAREDEANYVAYLACAEGDEYFQYSGAMYALYYAMESLHDADTIAWTEARMGMSKAVQSDYYRMNGLRNAKEPGFVRFKGTVTTAFMRVSRQQGARSYGDMVDLLLAERRAKAS